MRIRAALTPAQVERVARFQSALPHQEDCDFPPHLCSCATLFEILPGLTVPEECR